MIRRLLLAALMIGSFRSTSVAQLRQAVRDGDAEQVKKLLEMGSDANESYENQFTPIYDADKPEIVDILIAHGARLDLRDAALIQTPIENAAEHAAGMYSEDEDSREIWKIIVGKLRDAGADYTIDTAIFMNDIKFVEELLQSDDSWVNDRRKAQQVPLRRAAQAGRTEICKLLLKHGADPDSFEEGHGIPIIRVAVEHPRVVELLIDHGANLKRRITYHGMGTGQWIVEGEATALHYAVDAGNLGSVKLLIDAGLDPNAADQEGQTPLHIAIRSATVDRRSWGGKKAKSYAEIIRLLLENDASIEFRDRKGRTPIELAKEEKSFRIIKRLLNKKQDELYEMDMKAWNPENGE